MPLGATSTTLMSGRNVVLSEFITPSRNPWDRPRVEPVSQGLALGTFYQLNSKPFVAGCRRVSPEPTEGNPTGLSSEAEVLRPCRLHGGEDARVQLGLSAVADEQQHQVGLGDDVEGLAQRARLLAGPHTSQHFSAQLTTHALFVG